MPAPSRLREWLRNPRTGRCLPLPPRAPAELLGDALSGRPARVAGIAVALVAFLLAWSLQAPRVLAGLIVALVVLYLLQRLRLRRVVARAREALALVHGGELERGAALLEPLARTPLAPVSALSYSLGIARVLLGEHRAAVRALARVWRSEQA